MSLCVYCGSEKNLVRDHLVPRARGGLDIEENIVRACKRCNSSKNDKLPSEWRSDLPEEIYALERKLLASHPPLSPRKTKYKETAKEAVTNVRMTLEQQETLREAAAREGMGLSTWLLRLGLVEAETKRQAREAGAR